MDIKMLLEMFLSFTTELLVAGILLTKHKTNFRFKAWISIPVGLLIAYGTAMGVILVCKNLENFNEVANILSYTIASIGVYFAFRFAYKIKPFQLLLMLSVAYTFQHMAYQLSNFVIEIELVPFLYEKLGGEWYTNTYNVWLRFLIQYPFKALVYVGCYFLIAKTYIKYSKYILKTWFIIVLAFVMYFIINIANVYVVQHIFWWDYTMRGVMCATLIIFCLLFDTLIVGGFKVVERREETTIIKATLNSKVRQQEMTENNINFINMKCHDLRKELRKLKEKKGNLTDEDFMLLEESLNFYDSSVQTGNVNIDALIQDKLIYCNSVGIEFTSLVDGNAFENIASSDMYFLLTNIIDNAIEAAESFDEKEKRIISLTASNKAGVLVIEETNYFKGEIVFNSDGSIVTTKENKKYHGYGTKSINYIVKKYDGKMEIDAENGIFKMKIAI